MMHLTRGGGALFARLEGAGLGFVVRAASVGDRYSRSFQQQRELLERVLLVSLGVAEHVHQMLMPGHHDRLRLFRAGRLNLLELLPHRVHSALQPSGYEVDRHDRLVRRLKETGRVHASIRRSLHQRHAGLHQQSRFVRRRAAHRR